ncbi:MAG: protein kinase domain-containing protein [Isosphaeraceae bacterium]
MVKRSFECDADRLKSYLDDDLSPDDQAELAGHLDHCSTCQQAIERLAAGSRLWDGLRHLGGDADAPMTGLPAGGSRGKSRLRIGREGPELDFLAPSDNPAYLGRLGPYDVIDVLGEGGMGIVLKAFDPSLNRVVAIKVLAPQLAASGATRRRFFREAKAAAAVVHDHVVAIHAVDTDPKSGLPYLVMPCIDGRSLQDRIDRDGPLRPEEVLRIGMQTALGLAAAHAQGLVHRDIKPSNILLENGVERVKITDFGLARAIDDGSQSQSGVVAGTPQYMSPEQARGDSVDHRADLFSLGSLLYAMCAGHSPFRARTTMGVLRRVCDESPRPLFEINPEVPEALEQVVERLHAKDPAMRYQSASEVADVLGRQLAILQRPGARPVRRAPAADTHPVAKVQPEIKKSEPVDEWVSARPRRRFRTLAAAFLDVPPELFGTLDPRRRFRTLAAAALLVLLGLGAAVACARLASREEVPHYAAYRPSAGFASPPKPAPPPEGQGGRPASVIITNRDDARTIVGSGKPATKSWDLADFLSVEIRQPFRTSVTRADRFAVSVTTDDNVLDHVVVAREGSRLRVRLEDGLSYRLSGKDPLKLAITMPLLEEIDVGGAGKATIQGFASDRPFLAHLSGASTLEGSIRAGDVDFDISGASTLKLGGSGRTAKLLASGASHFKLTDWQVNGEKLTIDVSGASSARFRGSAQTAVLKAEGASQLHLADLALEAADVSLSGASHAELQVKSLLSYDVSSASHLSYRGEPTVSKASKTGASSVSHKK